MPKIQLLFITKRKEMNKKSDSRVRTSPLLDYVINYPLCTKAQFTLSSRGRGRDRMPEGKGDG